MAPLRLRDRHDGPGREQITALRRRPGGGLHARSTAARAPATSPTRTLYFMSRDAAACSAPATSTRSRSTTGRSEPATIAGALRRQRNSRRRLLHRLAQPGPDRPDASRSTPPPPATPTARSPSTSGTSTATAPMRPTPAPRRPPRRTYATAGTVTVGLRVTDNGGATAPRTRTLTVDSGEPAAVRRRGARHGRADQLLAPGRGERDDPGRQLGAQPRDRPRRRDARRPRRPARRPQHRRRFDGINDAATRPGQPVGHQQGDRRVLAEVGPPTPTTTAWPWSSPRTSTTTTAGFMVDPNDASGGSSRVGDRRAAARATTRISPGRAPAPGTTTPSSSTPRAPAAQQITPYVDGQAVAFTKPTAAPAPATSPTRHLYFMSRNATSLFGTGDLDEVAIYDRALTPRDDRRRTYAAGAATSRRPPPSRPRPTRPQTGPAGHLQRRRLQRPRRHDRQVRVGPRRQRHLRDRHRHHRHGDPHLRHRRHPRPSACG